jgi:anti-anti-sigma factor
MQIQVVRDGPVAIIDLDGLIDTRASQQFEKEAATLLAEDVSAVVVDFGKVSLITSAGIRVLFMMGQRLHRTGGGLALCCLNDRVRGVFEVAKLLQQFRITAARPEAIAAVAALAKARPQAPPPTSKLTRLVATALSEHGPEPAPGVSGGRPSALAALVLKAVKRNG